MNREIKFRAWDGEEMFYLHEGYHLRFWEHPNKVPFGLYRNDYNTLVSKHDRGLIVMQNTGLKDKNGKDIFEGDIIRMQVYWSGHPTFIEAKIKFEGGAFWFEGGGHTDCNWHHYNASDREIIGNIYETPEIGKGGHCLSAEEQYIETIIDKIRGESSTLKAIGILKKYLEQYKAEGWALRAELQESEDSEETLP
jgi:uncharacterized phage protein (TIGR01671 family)